MIYETVLKHSKSSILIHLSNVLLLAVLQQNKVFTKISLEYINYTNILFLDLIIKLSEKNTTNNYGIELIKGYLSFYRPIHSLNLVVLEIFKDYIDTHLKIIFILLSQFLASTFIFFYKKLKISFCQYIDYHCLNNLTIMNQYSLVSISKLLN